MLDPYLMPIETAVLVFPFVAILLLIPCCVFHYRRYGYLNKFRAGFFYSFLFYLLAAFFLVILPLPEITEYFCDIYAATQTPQLSPFTFIPAITEEFKRSGAGFSFISLLKNKFFLQAFFNFLLLLPLGFYFRYLYQTNLIKSFFIFVGTTLFFEVTQYTGIFGLYPCSYRLFDIDDLILNASGALLGYAIVPLFNFLPDPNQQRPAGLETVSPFRRLIALTIDLMAIDLLKNLVVGVIFPSLEDIQIQLLVVFLLYFIWFVLIPYLWKGYTIGKKIVLIQLVDRQRKAVTFWRLAIRYIILLFIPSTISHLFETYALSVEVVSGYWGILFLAILFLEFVLIIWLILFRKDHLGIHELLSGTQNINTWKPKSVNSEQ